MRNSALYGATGVLTLATGCTSVFGLGELSYEPSPGHGGSGTGTAAGTPSGAGAASSASSASGGGQNDCWKRAPDDWDDIVKVDRALLAGGGDAADFQLAADGLRLVYAASTTVMKQTVMRAFMAQRATRNAPFQGGQLLATWPGTTGNPPGQPWIDATTSEMYLEINAPKVYLARSALMGVNWSEPVAMTGFQDPGVSHGDPALAAKGTRLFYWRSDGNGGVAGPAYQMYEAVRTATADAFSAATAKPMAIAPIGKNDFMFCPSPAEDGNRFFFASTWPKVVDATNLTHATSVYYVERSGPSAAWSAPVHLTKLDTLDRENCPHGVTADGCELMFEFWTLATGTTDVFIARRVPK